MVPPSEKRPRISSPSNVGQYIEKLNGSTKFNKKFQTMQCDTQFQITNIPANPEGMLGGLFQSCIDSAIEECQAHDIVPDQLGFMISSILLDPDIYIPFRTITPNTVDLILNMFLKVAQSKQQNNITLWGEPFVLKVAAISVEGLPRERQIIGGRGKRKLANVHHNIRKKALIQIKNQNDGRCLFLALQATLKYKIGGMDRNDFYNYLKGRWGMRGKLDREANQLMAAIGAPSGLSEYDARIYIPLVVDYWNEKYSGHHNFKVFIFGAIGHYSALYNYPNDNNFDTPILLYYDENHFHGIRHAHGMFDRGYCLVCQSTFTCQAEHKTSCKARCRKCGRCGPTFPCQPADQYNEKCGECKKIFNNADCMDYHKRANFCQKSKQCEKCGIVWNVKANTENGRAGHVCEEYRCYRCNSFHTKKRGCFIKTTEPLKRKPYRIVCMDVETMQHIPAESDAPNKKKMHIVNFISARISCPECIESGKWKDSLATSIDECAVCGPNRTVTFGHRNFTETRVDFHHVTEDPTAEFVKWILYELPIQYDTVCFGHNAGRFDYMFLCKDLYKEKINPSLVRKGNKLFELAVGARPNLNPTIVFHDSYNLLNMPLAALVSAFDLLVADKPFFPYLANRPENYGVRMKGLPQKEEYLYNGFLPAKKKVFDEYYEHHKHEEFYLDEALASYCCNDTDILMEALIKFRTEFMEISKRPPDEHGLADRPSLKPHDGIDPLRECITIASACLKHFRTNHLKPNHLALCPEMGYDSAETQSLLALKFFQWYSDKNNVAIQTAHSEEGEKKIGKFKLDGWIDKEQRGIEVNGCVFHSCPRCYPSDDLLMPTGITAGKQREKDRKRLEFLRSKVPVEVFWECDIRKMVEDDEEMAKKFEEYLDEGPIQLRGCFYGGRTGPRKLYHKLQPGQKISYLDFTSLYPYTNYITKYPVGIPKVHILNEETNWTKPEDIPCPLSILKVFVIPPRQFKVPLLPMKLHNDERLLFPLCSKCARKNPKGNVDEDYSCEHTDFERGWVSTCTSIEAAEALRIGYRITKVYRILEYRESDDQLFRSYMREFLTEKFHSSGFDPSIKGNMEAEEKFIKECWDKFGIKIVREKMKPNKGKRALSKLCLNNLWGRLSLRNFGLSQSHITDDPAELRKFLEDRSLDVMAIDELNDDTIMISYIVKREWVEEGDASNVVISLWTTSQARLLLFKAMEKVANTPGCEILYTDTDSIVFSEPEDQNVLQISPHLGGLTDEIPQGYRIVEWISGGAKQYGLKMEKIGAEGDYEYTLKIRGMTLNHDVMANQGLCYETFKESVLQYARTGQLQPIQVNYPNFLRPSFKNGIVYTQPMQKIWKPFCGKGIVRPSDTCVLDFGYISPN